jgi:sporulation protein YlmC with PRC-barrel domain
MHLSELKGRRVVSRASAETLGDVSDLFLTTGPATVSALQVGKGRKGATVPWHLIVGIGPDAVVVTDDESAAGTAAGASPLGRLLLSELGNAAGTVTDVEFNESTGAVISLATESALVEGDRLLANGPYALIVSAREGAEFPG